MNTLRKVLTIVGVGLLFWSLSLIWPELNFMLALAVVAAVVLLAGLVGLALLWRQSLIQHQANKPRPRHPSRPITVH